MLALSAAAIALAVGLILLARRVRGLEARLRLLTRGDEGDLDDPIGAGRDVYRACATTIEKHLGRFLPEWTGT